MYIYIYVTYLMEVCTIRVIFFDVHMLFFMCPACMAKHETTQPKFYSKIDGPFSSHKT